MANKTYLDKLGLTYFWSKVKSFVNARTTPPGVVSAFAGATAPTGWLMCDGSAVSRITYADLFAIIGTTYGTGDGTTTFNLPNLKDRVPVGLDVNDTDFNTLGKTGGEKEVALSVDEIPAHRHGIAGNMWIQETGYGNINTGSTSNANRANITTGRTDYVGGGKAHNNLQPYVVQNYIIKY